MICSKSAQRVISAEYRLYWRWQTKHAIGQMKAGLGFRAFPRDGEWLSMPTRADYFICDPCGQCYRDPSKSYEDIRKVIKEDFAQLKTIWAKRLWPP